jgi:hypothetical protein
MRYCLSIRRNDNKFKIFKGLIQYRFYGLRNKRGTVTGGNDNANQRDLFSHVETVSTQNALSAKVLSILPGRDPGFRQHLERVDLHGIRLNFCVNLMRALAANLARKFGS